MLLSITRSQSQQSACKDLERDGQARAITPEAAYTPIAKRSCSRSPTKKTAPPAERLAPIKLLIALGDFCFFEPRNARVI
ncbi:Conserved protein [Lacticaseibacillus rhamnosus GG]|nr:Conserved protein [Lacticaseibacillus rhamnosus GG]